MNLSASSLFPASHHCHLGLFKVVILLYYICLHFLLLFFTVWHSVVFFVVCLFHIKGKTRNKQRHSLSRDDLGKFDDLQRAAISIIMKKLISWCTGLRSRLKDVTGGWGVENMVWKKKKGEKMGFLGWCRGGGCKCTISLAAVWCCSPRCHTSKREQIKGSSFDEYKTESPAEKHSPSLPF